MSMNEKSRLPMSERVHLPEVLKLADEYINVVLKLHDYRLRIDNIYIGGKDNCKIVGFNDMGSQKPIIIDYNEIKKSNGTQKDQSNERTDSEA